MKNLKAFIGTALVFAIIGTVMSLAIPVPIPLIVLFINALIMGAIVGGLSVLFRTTVFRKQASEHLAYALSAAVGTLCLFIVFALIGKNDGSIVAAISSIVFGGVSGFIGSLATRIGR